MSSLLILPGGIQRARLQRCDAEPPPDYRSAQRDGVVHHRPAGPRQSTPDRHHHAAELRDREAAARLGARVDAGKLGRVELL